MAKNVSNKTIDNVTIRFAGDSGDGMQLSGGRFTQTSAVVGNDLSTLPDFPAEIRAPAGSLAGVSSFQIHFSSQEIHTPGEKPDVLVAMNPAALKVHLKDLVPGGTLIVNKNNGIIVKYLKISFENDMKVSYEIEKNPIYLIIN